MSNNLEIPIYIKVTCGEYENCGGYILKELENKKYWCTVYKNNEPMKKVFNRHEIKFF